MLVLSFISCQPSPPWPGLANLHPSIQRGHSRQALIQTSRQVGQDKESLPGLSDWVPPLVDLLKRRLLLLVLKTGDV